MTTMRQTFEKTIQTAWDQLGVVDFHVEEIAPARFGAPPMNLWGNLIALGTVLQNVRNHFGRAVMVNSGYRPEWYNTQIGGVENSQHILLAAADIDVIGVSPSDVAWWLGYQDFAGRIGLGRYATFTHVDVRHWHEGTASPARWDNR